MFIALPVIVYQILRFIQPALPQKFGKKMITLIIASSFTLASIGIAFGYYVIVPLSLHFFAKYSTGQLKPLISSDSYLSYLTNNLVIFALVFQIPLLIYFINKIKPLKPKKLLHLQRYVIVGSFIIALILPFTYDPISQFVVAIPIIFLYYLSILIVLISNRKISKPKIEYVEEGPNLFIDEPIVQEIKEEIIQAVHEVNEIIEPAVNLIEQKAKPALKFIDGIYSERTNKLIKSNSSSNYHYRISPKIITLSNEESSEDEPFSINVATG